jgi:hypothetical protein
MSIFFYISQSNSNLNSNSNPNSDPNLNPDPNPNLVSSAAPFVRGTSAANNLLAEADNDEKSLAKAIAVSLGGSLSSNSGKKKDYFDLTEEDNESNKESNKGQNIRVNIGVNSSGVESKGADNCESGFNPKELEVSATSVELVLNWSVCYSLRLIQILHRVAVRHD